MASKSKTLSNIWRKYPHRYDVKDDLYCDEKEFKDICRTVNKLVSQLILEGNIVHLPHRMGDLYIKKAKTKPNKRKLNVGLSRQLGKKIYFSNNHSNGYYARWHWGKNYGRSLFVGKSLYSFKPTRTNKLALSELIIKHNYINKYLE